MPQGQDKDRSNNWKNKAIERGLENKKLRREIERLKDSRTHWKQKYLSQKSVATVDATKARGHQYPVCVVLFFVMLQRYGNMSLRGCRNSLIYLHFMGMSFRIPSHNSIRNWACKLGYSRIYCKKVSPHKYVLYLDESITFGSEKILLILGLPEDKIPVGRSVTHADMEVLFVGISDSWTAEHIKAELDKIRLTYHISYIVSDQGNNLKSAYKMGDYTHMEDCTHIFANILKRQYQADIRFKHFSSFISTARKAFYLSKTKSQYLPPTLRGKMRFANMFTCVSWAESILKKWDNLPLEVKTALAFLQDERGFIHELTEQKLIFTKTCEWLKNYGFSYQSGAEITTLLTEFGESEKVQSVAKDVLAYIDQIAQKCEVLKIQSCVCSSDIIESYFGKFKQKINPNNKNKLSEFVLTLANFGKDFDYEEVKKALEEVEMKDLKNYKKNNKSRDKK
jgi:hypothetical protein